MKRIVNSSIIAATLMATSINVAYAKEWKDEAKDAWIDGKAEATLLLNTNLNSFDINTDVDGGKVILTGKVGSEVDKALAEELMESVDGVTGVENKLHVLKMEKGKKEEANDLGNDLTDMKIATVVKTRLLFESEVNGTSIEVDVNKGVVSLKGKVDSDAEKDLAEMIAKNTKDVEKVVNDLGIVK